MKFLRVTLLSLLTTWGLQASATDLDVMHWWTSGGEAAAVAEFAQAFSWVDANATGNMMRR